MPTPNPIYSSFFPARILVSETKVGCDRQIMYAPHILIPRTYNYVTWQRGTKVADGIRLANQLTLK